MTAVHFYHFLKMYFCFLCPVFFCSSDYISLLEMHKLIFIFVTPDSRCFVWLWNKMRNDRGTAKEAWHNSRQCKRNTKHCFWQLLPASPSVTLIIIQLQKDGCSVQRSGTQPGSRCEMTAHASALELRRADACWHPLFLPPMQVLCPTM